MCSEAGTDVCSNFLTPSASPGPVNAASRPGLPRGESRWALPVDGTGSEGQASHWPPGAPERRHRQAWSTLCCCLRDWKKRVSTRGPLPPGPGASPSHGLGVDRTARPCPFLPGLPGAAKLPEGLALLGSPSRSVSSAGPGGGQGQLASPAGVSQGLVSVPWTGPRPS